MAVEVYAGPKFGNCETLNDAHLAFRRIKEICEHLPSHVRKPTLAPDGQSPVLKMVNNARRFKTSLNLLAGGTGSSTYGLPLIHGPVHTCRMSQFFCRAWRLVFPAMNGQRELVRTHSHGVRNRKRSLGVRDRQDLTPGVFLAMNTGP